MRENRPIFAQNVSEVFLETRLGERMEKYAKHVASKFLTNEGFTMGAKYLDSSDMAKLLGNAYMEFIGRDVDNKLRIYPKDFQKNYSENFENLLKKFGVNKFEIKNNVYFAKVDQETGMRELMEWYADSYTGTMENPNI